MGGRPCVNKNAGGVGVTVGEVCVAVAVGVAVDVGVAVGGTEVEVAVGSAATVKVADGKTTALVTVGGVVVGCTGPHDASKIVSATPTIQ